MVDEIRNVDRMANAMRVPVRVSGTLRGAGYEAECEMIAMKHFISLTGRHYFSHFVVVRAPADLPDGEYIVTFRGGSARIRREHGAWTVGEELAGDALTPEVA